MGARYIWNKYSKKTAFQEKHYPFRASIDFQNIASYAIICGKGYTFDSRTGCFALTGYTVQCGGNGYINAAEFPYAMAHPSLVNNDYRPVQRILLYSSTGYWHPELRTSSYRVYITATYGGNGIDHSHSQYIGEAVDEKDSFLNKVSSSSSNAYPNDGAKGDYWYTLQGSDCIDPTAISYSNAEPKAGETITTTVTPANNTYGGTISYQYQYSTNGGSTWVNSGGRTTSITDSFTIPKGTTQLRVRVNASDDYGFTSTTLNCIPSRGQ